MTENGIALLLAAAEDAGALALRDLWREVALVADGKQFTSAEILAHAKRPENLRLRDALAAVCGEKVGAVKVGLTFTRWRGVSLCGLVIENGGSEANAVLWSVHPKPRCAEAEIFGNMAVLPTPGMTPCD